MIVYLVFVVTTILVGLAAVILSRDRHPRDARIFLAGALLNAGALLVLWLRDQRRRD